MTIAGTARPKVPQRRRFGLGLLVLLVHLSFLPFLARVSAPEPAADIPPPVEVVLVSPPPPPPPPPPLQPAVVAGGGSPAAPSRVNILPDPPPVPPEIVAPPVQAPEPSIVVGTAPYADAVPGPGLGGQGTGSGGGTGAGRGPGRGGRPLLLSGPSVDQIRRVYPRAALNAGVSGRGLITCRIRLDTRLEDCRLVEESPPGRGFGAAALATAANFRFRPPTIDGEPLAGAEITFGVDFDAGQVRGRR
ncbi:TonB family protein [Brevundimonas vitis]|uniref:TonB family protein n=1 Tax=Brevundimonas vitisensis TaxID=2800818 RepID=A0ABX7BMF7_9CAUL|nr:TonB family protein [Brevundimonas vitisensis]QQQ18456.1 TonB family protein [Brevundimonas vitisensis]